MPRHVFWPSRSDLNCTRERMLRKPVLHMPWLQADYGDQVYFRESEKVKVKFVHLYRDHLHNLVNLVVPAYTCTLGYGRKTKQNMDSPTKLPDMPEHFCQPHPR